MNIIVMFLIMLIGVGFMGYEFLFMPELNNNDLSDNPLMMLGNGITYTAITITFINRKDIEI